MLLGYGNKMWSSSFSSLLGQTPRPEILWGCLIFINSSIFELRKWNYVYMVFVLSAWVLFRIVSMIISYVSKYSASITWWKNWVMNVCVLSDLPYVPFRREETVLVVAGQEGNAASTEYRSQDRSQANGILNTHEHPFQRWFVFIICCTRYWQPSIDL